MAKQTPHRRKQRAETVALPTADNAKWLAIGFLTSLGVVLFSVIVLVSSRLH